MSKNSKEQKEFIDKIWRKANYIESERLKEEAEEKQVRTSRWRKIKAVGLFLGGLVGISLLHEINLVIIYSLTYACFYENIFAFRKRIYQQ